MSLEYSNTQATNKKLSLRNSHRCEICQYFTTSLFLMANHVRRHSQIQNFSFSCATSSPETYYCKDCNFQTELTVSFRQHLSQYHNVNRICRIVNNVENDTTAINRADFSLDRQFMVKWRQRIKKCIEKGDDTMEDEHMYKCQYCNFTCESKCRLKQHRLLTHFSNQKVYPCTQCSYIAKQVQYLKTHMIYRHMDDNDIQWFECEECPYKAKQKPALITHIKMRHVNEQEIIWHECQKCSYKAKRKASLTKHIKKYHVDEKYIKWYKCEQCVYKTKHQECLTRHVTGHHSGLENVKWCQCKKCPFKTKVSSTLTARNNAQHLMKCYECKQCPFKTNHLSSLYLHRKRHLDVKDITWYECKECSFKTRYKQNFQKHVKVRHGSDSESNIEHSEVISGDLCRAATNENFSNITTTCLKSNRETERCKLGLCIICNAKI